MKLNFFYKSLLSIVLCCSPLIISAQVSTFSKTKKIGYKSFNYNNVDDKQIRLRKNKYNIVVYSDRNENQFFEDPYGQYKKKKESIGTPFYIIDKKYKKFKLALCEPDIIGKPQNIFGLFLRKRNHFLDPKSTKLEGWISQENILMYNHAFLDSKNNLPIKYRIGISRFSRLFDMQHYVKGDTINVFGNPTLKNKNNDTLINGQIVYAYKFDKNKKAVLISDKPYLNDSARKVLGWVPVDLIAKVGQNYSFIVNTNYYNTNFVYGTTLRNDSMSLKYNSLESDILFDYDGNFNSTKKYKTKRQIRKDTTVEDSIKYVDINFPISVWDHSYNKLINVKGGDILISDIAQIENQKNKVNIHLIFFRSDTAFVKGYINVLQNLKINLLENNNYTFSASCLSSRGSMVLPPTEKFNVWLDFVNNIVSNGNFVINYNSGVYNHIFSNILKNYPDPYFGQNIFLCFGTNEKIDINNYQIQNIVRKSGKVLFLQIKNTSDQEYQNFILNSKKNLDKISTSFSDFVANYIIDDKLIKPELFSNMDSEDANIYMYDVPNNSLNAGGLVFPKGVEILPNVALRVAIDSLMVNSSMENELLLNALSNGVKKLGVLRSRPSYEITDAFNRLSPISDTLDISNIDRNSISDAYYLPIQVVDTCFDNYKNGYLLLESELEDVIQNYRSLLPEFDDTITKHEVKYIKKNFRKIKRSINKTFYRKMINRKSRIADIFYYKNGFPVNDSLLCELRIKNLRKKFAFSNGFIDAYPNYIKNIRHFEDLFILNKFEQKYIGNDKFYFIPKNSVL